MTQVPTAEDLLARVRERDADALGELYDGLAPGLLGMLLRILGDRDAAEEILDDVFLGLWNEAPGSAWQHASVAAGVAIRARNAATRRAREGSGARRARMSQLPRAPPRSCARCLFPLLHGAPGPAPAPAQGSAPSPPAQEIARLALRLGAATQGSGEPLALMV